MSDPWPMHTSDMSISSKAFLKTIYNCQEWQIPHHVVNWKQVFLNPQQCTKLHWSNALLT